jgi:hypothetical protein
VNPLNSDTKNTRHPTKGTEDRVYSSYVNLRSISIPTDSHVVEDVDRNSLPNMILTIPGQPISIIPELVLQIVSSGGLWVKAMLPQLEETSPQETNWSLL